MSFSVRNSNNFSLNDLADNALYLQPLAAGYRSGSTTAANAANTIVLNASKVAIPDASTVSGAFFVAPIRSRVVTNINSEGLYYDVGTKEIVVYVPPPPQ